jgi:hypothetical protein
MTAKCRILGQLHAKRGVGDCDVDTALSMWEVVTVVARLLYGELLLGFGVSNEIPWATCVDLRDVCRGCDGLAAVMGWACRCLG